MRKIAIDPRIKVGMIATLWKDGKRENVHVYKISQPKKSVSVISPRTKEITEFSLRTNDCWIKVGEKTISPKTTLIFPELLRRDLISAFCKF